MFKRLLQQVRKRLLGKELVGVDSKGNHYYRWQEKEPTYTGRMIEKREVNFAVSGEYDPKSLPPEWVAWLHRFRTHPPTAEECKQIEQDSLRRAERVAALEAEEERRRFRVQSLEAQGMSVDAQPNMKRYVEQLTSLGYGDEKETTREKTSDKGKRSDT